MNMKKCQIMRNWETLYKTDVIIAYKTITFLRRCNILCFAVVVFYILLKIFVLMKTCFPNLQKGPNTIILFHAQLN